MGLRVLQRLDMLVDGDRDDPGPARDVAAHHQDDAELAQRMGEAEHDRGEVAPERERRGDGEEGIERRGAQRRGGLERAAADRLERALQRLDDERSEEHTSELQSLMRISYAVFCLKKKK